MSLYVKNIVTALMVFPFAAFVFTLPYAVFQYKKYGSIPFIRVLVVYSMILYLICAYFMVILPLPSREAVAQMTSPVMQLRPFQFVADFFRESGFVLSQPSTYLTALKSSQMLVVLFNIALFIPLGIYLKYYYERKWYEILLFSFLLSLFFELTQLSGLYGIYARAYRLFDVDDLLLNTVGGMLGCLIAPLFMKILPSRDRLDDISYERGKRVSLSRRTVAAIVDWITVAVLQFALGLLFGTADSDMTDASYALVLCLCVAIVFFAVPITTKGYTPGKFLVGIRLAAENGAPKFYSYIVRYGLLYFVLLPLPLWGVFFLSRAGDGAVLFALVGGLLLLVSVYVHIRFLVEFIMTAVKKESKFLYERISGIKNVSTVKISDDEAENDKSIA